MDLSIVNKHSSRNLGIGAVLWSLIGGIELGRGIQQILIGASKGSWLVSFIFGSAFLAYGVFWVVMLVRRANLGARAI